MTGLVLDHQNVSVYVRFLLFLLSDFRLDRSLQRFVNHLLKRVGDDEVLRVD